MVGESNQKRATAHLQLILSCDQLPMRNELPSGDTRLHDAVHDGRVDQVANLLEWGTDPNLFDDLGKTPLHYAVEREDLEMIRVLLSGGADVNAHDARDIGNTPLRQVAQRCSLEVARLLIQAGADPTIEGWMRLTALDKAALRKRGDGPAIYKLFLDAAKKRR